MPALTYRVRARRPCRMALGDKKPMRKTDILRCRRAIAASAMCMAAASMNAWAADALPTGKLPRWAVPTSYDISLRADPADAQFSGQVAIQVSLKKQSAFVWINGQSLDVTRVSVRDAKGDVHNAHYQIVDADAGLAKVVFAQPLSAQKLTLSFVYSAPYNTNLDGFYKVVYQDKPYVMTQFEAISARLAFPSFDEPDFKTPFSLHLTVPKNETVVANTQAVGHHPSGKDWQTVDFARTRPLPTYLIAFAIGPWDVEQGPDIAKTSWRSHVTPLRGIAAQGKGAELAPALAQTPDIVTALEAYYDYGYPFDKLDVLAAPDFSAGAMENAGLVTFRDWYMLLTPESPLSSVRDSFEVEAHELAHQWTGDTVTMTWWNDLWLNESFATWMQQKITHQLHPEYHADLDRIVNAQRAMADDSLTSARQIRQPIQGIGDIGNAFDGITYAKGASVLGMFESFVGDKTFRQGMRAYIHDHEFGNATADDLVDAITKAADRGKDFRAAFGSFLNQSGVPYVSTQLRQTDNGPALAIQQQRYLPTGSTGQAERSWGLPLCIKYPLAAGGTHTVCQLVSQQGGQIALKGAAAKPAWIMPNAGGQGYYRFALDGASFQALGEHLDALSDPEKLAFADAASAAFQKNQLDTQDMIQLMRWLGASDIAAVALQPLKPVTWIAHHGVHTSAQREGLRAAASDVYLPRLNALGYQRQKGESPDAAELRSRLSTFLGVRLGVPAVVDALAAQGKAVLDTQKHDDTRPSLNFAAANPDLLSDALTVAVRKEGKPAVEQLMNALRHNGDANQRNAMITALSRVQDPKLLRQVRDFALTDAIKVGEMVALLSDGGRHSAGERAPAQVRTMWPWFKAHYVAIRERMGPFSGSGLPGLAAAGACSNEAAKQLDTFFEPKLDDLRGAKRSLAQTRETISLCAALAEAHDKDSWTMPGQDGRADNAS